MTNTQEATAQEYLAKLFTIFMECHRVLRDDGTLWLNLGDKRNPKTKALLGLPWKLSLKLAEEGGWILRSDIIWSKLNCLPESATDRPSQVHEYVFLFSKQRKYFFDQLAIAEPLAPSTPIRQMRGVGANHKYTAGAPGQKPHTLSRPRPALVPHAIATSNPIPNPGSSLVSVTTNPAIGEGNFANNLALSEELEASRNSRSVWQLASVPGIAGHFAAFPPAMPEKCILAATSAYGCCARCAAPFRRVIERAKDDMDLPALPEGGN